MAPKSSLLAPVALVPLAGLLFGVAGCLNQRTDAPASSSPAAQVVRAPELVAAASPAAATARANRIDFNTHIRPLLNQNCTSCHGGVKAAGDISFVYRDAVGKVGKKSNKPVIVPGNPEASELIARVTSGDKDYRMPPADHGPALAPDKIALLREWIKQGATWEDHWAFMAPQPQAVPAVPASAAVSDAVISHQAKTRSPMAQPQITDSFRTTPIDAFVRARLVAHGLTPAPEATRPALLRRVSLDLIGLPPTPEEIAAFAGDTSPDAYEKQVDRLLASPHFGERWASVWLDLARYADTKGFEADRERTVWPYRDWVVEAFNRNLPYDRFALEQLAGDLLPNPTMQERVATTFHRLTQVNDEGGTDDEEFRTVAVIDRVSTTWQVLNAVTFGCAQCHSHPYDPIRHEEYYRFFAILNGTRDADFNEEHPTLRVPDQRARHAEALQLRHEIEALRHDVITAGKALESGAKWTPLGIAAAHATPKANITVRDGALFAEGAIAANARYEVSVPIPALSLEPITAVRFEVPPDDPDTARHTPERGFIVTQVELSLTQPDGTVVPLKPGRFFPDTYNLETTMTKAVPRARPPEPTPASPVVAQNATPDEGRDARPARPRPRGPPGPTEGTLTLSSSSAATSSSAPQSASRPTPRPANAAARPAPQDMRDVTLDFHFAANPTLNRPRWIVAALPEPILAPPGAELRVTLVHGRQIASKPAVVRRLRVAASTDPRWNALARDPELAKKAARVTDAIAELAKIPGTDLPIMAELPPGEGRETRLFHRGNFLEKKGEPLAPGTPSLFPPLPRGQSPDRLALAKWFFQPGQPLTARVAVNRFWEQLFGTGIVATLEDFGSVGEPPSHPELLDWLALRFERDLRWDMKALLREIVTSATYRQDASATPEELEKDPANRLLARGPRQRLTAEMVRDQALAASGLLSRKLGGAPVMPPQPAGVWQTVYNNKDWVESKGEDRHRRAIYTFWKRTAAYPGFLTFDMPARDFCTARRTPTNTPLQALVTLNDVVYQEAAATLAGNAKREAGEGASTEVWIARAFERVISRPPHASETARLRRLHDELLAAAPGDSAGASRGVAIAILNLDAAFVR